MTQSAPLAQAAVPSLRADQLWHEPGGGRDLLRTGPEEVTLRLHLSGRSQWAPRAFVEAEDGCRRLVPMIAFAREGDRVHYRCRLRPGLERFRYRFRIQEGDGQFWFGPEGVAGSPEAAGAFAARLGATRSFVTPSWVHSAVFYQIFPDRFHNGDPGNDPEDVQPWGECNPTFFNFFGGDLQGIIDRIPYLEQLGVTALWLNPIFLSPSNHKYDTADYLQVDDHLGDQRLLEEMVRRLHRAGIRLILDGVFNHTGDRFWAFLDVEEKGPDSRYYHWYHIYEWPLRRNPPSYATWWGFGHLPQLNTKNPEVREYLLEVARFWTGLGIDGWRLDVPNEVDHEFWKAFRAEVKRVNPEAYVVGEIWHDGSPWLQGDQFDGVMNYLFRDAVLAFAGRGEICAREFEARLRRLRLGYLEPAQYASLNLLGSHDTERLLTACGGDPRRARAAALLQFTYAGPPMVYYGDEVGMAGGKDPECRATFPWEDRKQDLRSLEWYHRLIRLRRRYPVLATGEVCPVPVQGSQVRAAEGTNGAVANGSGASGGHGGGGHGDGGHGDGGEGDGGAGRVTAFARVDASGSDPVVVAVNGGDGLACVDLSLRYLPVTPAERRWVDLLSGRRVEASGGELIGVTLSPFEGMVLAPGLRRPLLAP